LSTHFYHILKVTTDAFVFSHETNGNMKENNINEQNQRHSNIA